MQTPLGISPAMLALIAALREMGFTAHRPAFARLIVFVLLGAVFVYGGEGAVSPPASRAFARQTL